MMRALALALVLLLIASSARTVADEPAPVPCKTIDDCWLSSSGEAIKRPKRWRGHATPRGDCGGKHNWLRHRLTCEANVCTAITIGDKC